MSPVPFAWAMRFFLPSQFTIHYSLYHQPVHHQTPLVDRQFPLKSRSAGLAGKVRVVAAFEDELVRFVEGNVLRQDRGAALNGYVAGGGIEGLKGESLRHILSHC